MTDVKPSVLPPMGMGLQVGYIWICDQGTEVVMIPSLCRGWGVGRGLDPPIWGWGLVAGGRDLIYIYNLYIVIIYYYYYFTYIYIL